MPKYRVITTRCLTNTVLIEASDETAARQSDGEILDEAETDTWLESVDAVDEVHDAGD